MDTNMVILRERYLGAAIAAIVPASRRFFPTFKCDRFIQIVAAPTVRKPVTMGASQGRILSAAQFLAHCP
ncbi:MAG: hypothetical protein ACRD1Z_03225 [Vicinamibacteria bacterium]